jgi:hypothetical protein
MNNSRRSNLIASHVSSRPFVVGALVFVSFSTFSILILVLGFFPSEDWPFTHFLYALVVDLAFGPANLLLSLVVWPLYSSLPLWYAVMTLGWLISAFAFGKYFQLIQRAVRGTRGYLVGLLTGIIFLVPVVFITSVMLYTG